MSIIDFQTTNYQDGNLCILAECKYDDGETESLPISVNIPEYNGQLQVGEFFLKNWSEMEEIAKAILDSTLVGNTGKTVPAGYVNAPICRLQTTKKDTIHCDCGKDDCDECSHYGLITSLLQNLCRDIGGLYDCDCDDDDCRDCNGEGDKYNMQLPQDDDATAWSILGECNRIRMTVDADCKLRLRQSEDGQTNETIIFEADPWNPDEKGNIGIDGDDLIPVLDAAAIRQPYKQKSDEKTS
jgi:hypothetical protein